MTGLNITVYFPYGVFPLVFESDDAFVDADHICRHADAVVPMVDQCVQQICAVPRSAGVAASALWERNASSLQMLRIISPPVLPLRAKSASALRQNGC